MKNTEEGGYFLEKGMWMPLNSTGVGAKIPEGIGAVKELENSHIYYVIWRRESTRDKVV